MEAGTYRSAAPWVVSGVSLPQCHISSENFKQFELFYIASLPKLKSRGSSSAVVAPEVLILHQPALVRLFSFLPLAEGVFNAAESNRAGS